ncbi:substance-K receptor-like [Actinia tenebrosa]|uniref:Substance-K receptor-like n=1 Tax=Actinia tenebrosa TaxID=6105 RepID=A0A6P8HBU6_ACTTE|nr:substance-K receptor-like [Actinia tenebrosa]
MLSCFSIRLSLRFLLLFLILIIISKAQNQNETKNSTRYKEQTSDLEDFKRFILGPEYSSDLARPITVFFMVLVAMVSIISNSLIIHVIRINQHMRTMTNYFILNMALGDLVSTASTAPLTIKYLFNGTEWTSGTFGMITCKVVHFFTYVAFFCSIFSLVAMTFDRFMAVICPLKYKYFSLWTKFLFPVVWITSLALPAQFAIVKFDIENYFNKTYCLVSSEMLDDSIIMISIGNVLPNVAVISLYSIIAYKLWTRRVPGDESGAAQRQDEAQQTAKKVTRRLRNHETDANFEQVGSGNHDNVVSLEHVVSGNHDNDINLEHVVLGNHDNDVSLEHVVPGNHENDVSLE